MVVPHLCRAEDLCLAAEESALRLRTCVSRESHQKEMQCHLRLMAAAESEVATAEAILSSCKDSPLLKDSAREAIAIRKRRLLQMQQHAPEYESGMTVSPLDSIIIQERNREILQLEQDFRLLAEITADVQTLIASHQPALDSLETQLDNVKTATTMGVEQLAEAEKACNQARKRRAKMVLWGVLIVCTLGAGLVVYKLVR